MDDSWLLPYADMLTLLLALFIVLFASSEVDSQKYQELAAVFKSEFSGGSGPFYSDMSPGSLTEINSKDAGKEDKKIESKRQDKEDMEQIQREIYAYIHDNDLSDSIDTQLTDDGLLVTILTDVTFDSGSAKVNSRGEDIAREVSNFLDTNPPRQIVISGHADDRPIHNSEFESNWELSVFRSVNFMKLILENDNLEPEKFSSKGFGDKQPIVPNDSEKNMAKNRRVEVLILPLYEDDAENKSIKESD